ncbi:MAG: hypothetical protein N2Z72_02125 [Bacteroidales bacterium]|nr:hypothetical protein [Bacteroidales bacterium]
MNRSFFIVFFGIHCLIFFAQSWQGGIPIIKNYRPADYKGYSQNWSVIQNDNRILMVANGDGVLMYDGFTWEKIILPNYATPLRFLKGKNGIIWVSGFSELGYLFPNIKEGYTYVSLKPLLPSEHRVFSFIKEMAVTSSGVYFNTKTHIFQFSLKGVHVISVPSGIHLSQWNDQAFLFSEGNIYVLDDHKLNRIDSSRLITRVLASSAIASDTLLLWDETNGLLCVSSRKEKNNISLHVTKIPVPIEPILKENSVSHFIKLSLGGYAFATLKKGTFLMDHRFNLITHLSRETGLINETHNYLYEDPNRNLWISMDYGLAKINLNAPLFQFNYSKGIRGSVLDVTRIGSKILAGTWQGLFILDTKLTDHYFHLHPQISTQVWKFLPIKLSHHLYQVMITSSGVFLLDSLLNLKKIDEGNFFHLATLKNPDLIASAQRMSISVYQYQNKRWSKWTIFIGDNIRSMVGWENHLYVSTMNKGIFHITFFQAKDQLIWKKDSLILPPEVSKNELKTLFLSSNKVLLSTNNGLYHLQGSFIVPWISTQNSLYKLFPTFRVSYIAQGNDSVYWVQLDSKELGKKILLTYHPLSNWVLRTLSFFPPLEIYNIYLDGDSLIWFSTDEGVFCYDRRLEFLSIKKQKDVISSISVQIDDSLLYHGISDQGNWIYLGNISYSKKLIRFVFSSSNYEDESQNIFICKLNNHDHNWQVLENRNVKEYSNLSPGHYTFQVKSISPSGTETDIKLVEFRVLSPWYMSWWAIVFGIMILFILLTSIVFYLNRRLIHAKIRLEKQVRERTKEIELRNKELELEKEKSDFLLYNILPVKVAEELKTRGKFKPIKVYQASVLFTDFVRFSVLTEQYTSEELVEKLDLIFSRFDDICSRYNLEKVKTIGDSHMSVGGIPVFSQVHAIDAALAAVEMVDFIEYLHEVDETFKPWKLRIGIHTGHLIAGVVGKRKFGFDVWGSTVNMASRLQESSEPNKINISHETALQIEEFFDLTYRGKIAVKHQGEIHMYFIDGIKAKYSVDGKGKRPNKLFREKYVKLLQIQYLNL